MPDTPLVVLQRNREEMLELHSDEFKRGWNAAVHAVEKLLTALEEKN